MRILAVIPARYGSTRFPGKPLADIHGRPMVWWVYKRVLSVRGLDSVVVATDDDRIMEVCNNYGMNCIKTRNDVQTSTERVYEISRTIDADLYVVVNGDEPLIDPEVVEKIIPSVEVDGFYVSNLMTKIHSPAETVDFTNIKVVVDEDSNALFFSRSPIPYPKSSVEYDYYKHVGVLLYSKEALSFFVNTRKGPLECIEDINELRFVEHGRKIKMVLVECESLSVDNEKDLIHVRNMMANH